MLEKIFKLKANNTNIKTEIVAGLTTFLTMSYIIFVNPNLLHNATGMDQGAVFVATCLAAAVGTALMALVANWPIGLAPGMGLNSFFAFTVVKTMGYTWEQALAAVFVSGIVFLLLTILGLRKWLIKGIPISLRQGITAGIGLFLAITAFKTTGIVTANPNIIMSAGNLLSTEILLVALGLMLIVILENFKIKGAILFSILTITLLSILLGYSHLDGIINYPPSLAPTFFKLDLKSILELGLLQIILVFTIVEMFDATGTLIGVSQKAGLLAKGKADNLNKALFADSTAILSGSILGTSSTTAYIESAAGVQAGGRTGLTALTIAICFLICLWFSPLAAAVPTFATAPALIYVAILMVREITSINWEDLTEIMPTILTAICMPFMYSIADGLAIGFISYTSLKLTTGKYKEIHIATWIITLLFILHYIYL
ncbi:NCS2 family permease [Bartonella sp. DGB1]|uniref:NCS2 family permease n=1 Tax=Bartonella sp. DGB1 TaxID=3239807 RepID=UPI003523500B